MKKRMRIKYAVFTVLFIMILTALSLGLIIAADMYYHNKFLQHHGLNYRGYRGRVVGSKRGNEIRIIMLGGSSAFGYGVHYNEALPYRLEEELQNYCNSNGINKKVTVINLGYNNEGAYAFYFNLKDFLYLKYDYVIFYDGYNDLGIGNVTVYRHSNPVFRAFKYMPILPLIIEEKKMVLQSGGRLEDMYLGKKIVFTPSPKEKIQINILNSALKVYNTFDNFANRVSRVSDKEFDMGQIKKDKWAWYKYYMKKAIDFALGCDKKAVVITQPYISDEHREQQGSLKKTIFNTYKDNKNFLYLNLGEAISLKEGLLTFDGMHLNADGCKKMAAIIAQKIEGYVIGK
ncbi:MAG: SGNH/GDSL hydrolase family protein [Candidatus Omnitrophota bacterium]|jgi:hypothetical protein